MDPRQSSQQYVGLVGEDTGNVVYDLTSDPRSNELVGLWSDGCSDPYPCTSMAESDSRF
jgi:hypothetical protein